MTRFLAIIPPGILSARRRFSWRGWAMRVLVTLEEWERRGEERRALARLDDHLLRDIGRTRAEVLAECEKPFWKG